MHHLERGSVVRAGASADCDIASEGIESYVNLVACPKALSARRWRALPLMGYVENLRPFKAGLLFRDLASHKSNAENARVSPVGAHNFEVHITTLASISQAEARPSPPQGRRSADYHPAGRSGPISAPMLQFSARCWPNPRDQLAVVQLPLRAGFAAVEQSLILRLLRFEMQEQLSFCACASTISHCSKRETCRCM
jgi:hypothetical protein